MDNVLIVPYNPEWPALFKREKTLVLSVLPRGMVTRIEHFGSTAVPGLPAKPVIDILVGVVSLAEARREAVPVLESLGYSYWTADPRTDHLFLVKGLPPNGPRSHHIHIVASDHATEWGRVLFRDYLRAHPDEVTRYATLKRDLATRHAEDREAYTEGKAAFITRVTALAHEEYMGRMGR